MRFDILVKSLGVGGSLALIGWAFLPGSGLFDLAKLGAVAVGASFLVSIAYPHLVGVRRGDTVLVFTENNVPLLSFRMKTGVALSNARVGDKLRIAFNEGEAEVELTNYAGLITPARAKLCEESVVKLV